jgi:hypothetical protein
MAIAAPIVMKRRRCHDGKSRIEGRPQATASIRPDIPSRVTAANARSSDATKYRYF